MNYELYTRDGDLLGSTENVGELACGITSSFEGVGAVIRWVRDSYDTPTLAADLVNGCFMNLTTEDFARDFIAYMLEEDLEDDDRYYGLTVRVKEE